MLGYYDSIPETQTEVEVTDYERVEESMFESSSQRILGRPNSPSTDSVKNLTTEQLEMIVMRRKSISEEYKKVPDGIIIEPEEAKSFVERLPPYSFYICLAAMSSFIVVALICPQNAFLLTLCEVSYCHT